MKSTNKWSNWVGTDDQWDDLLVKFTKPCVYQSSSWARHRANFGWRAIRLVNESRTSCAQVLIKSVLATTVAWIPGGPTGEVEEVNQELIAAIQRNTKHKRIFVRLNLLHESDNSSEMMLNRNGWHRAAIKLSSGFSLICTLSNSESARRDRLSANWSRNLRRGESRNKVPYLWRDVNSTEVAELYKQLSNYKNIAHEGDILSPANLESLLTSCQNQLTVFRCDDDSGEPLAIRGALTFGDQAWDILAVVSPQGRKQYSSYVTTWALLNYCANSNISRYDLSGIDPVSNKGVYDFKHGVGASEIEYIGEWECGSPAFVQPVVGRLLKYRKNL
jgi:lipid II:glycine glycyltransferase (peptidoglycan interpeptide bridge formation enzyme)